MERDNFETLRNRLERLETLRKLLTDSYSIDDSHVDNGHYARIRVGSHREALAVMEALAAIRDGA